MTRIATVPLQRTLADAIQRNQEKLAVSQQQLATGRKAADYAALGTETVRNLSAHGMIARQDAFSAVGKRIGTTMAVYQNHLDALDDTMQSLRNAMLDAVGTGNAAGLQAGIEAAFNQFRAMLNADEGGVPLFAGGRTDTSPFSPETLSDAAAIPAEDAFRDGTVRATARVAEGVDVAYGIPAGSIGRDLYEAFRTLAQGGPIDGQVSAGQGDTLRQAMDRIDAGLSVVRAANAANGRKQAQVEDLSTRAEQRALVFQDVIASNEDADLGQVAVDLAQQQAMLQASYSVFARISDLNLTQYL